MGMEVGSPCLTMSLMPRFWHDISYSAIIAFLLMGSDNFGPDEFKQAFFNELTWQTSGACFDVMLFLLGIMLSCMDE